MPQFISDLMLCPISSMLTSIECLTYLQIKKGSIMEQVVLDTESIENGFHLYKHGPTNKSSLPTESIKDLEEQGLVEIDEHEIATLTERGMLYFRELKEEQQRADLEKQQEEAEEEFEDDDDSDEEEEEEDEDKEVDEEETKAALESAALLHKPMRREKDIAILDADHIALEGVSDILINSLPTIINGYSGFQNALSKVGKIVALSFKRSTLSKQLERVSYVDLSQLQVSVPQGLAVDYLSYINILENAVDRAEKVEPLVDSFISVVAQLLTNPEQQKDSVRKDSFYRDLQTSRETQYATIGSCFSNQSKAKMPYGKLVARNRDWDAVTNKVNDLIDRMNKINRTKLLQKSKHLRSLLDKVAESSKRGGFDSASPETVKLLAEGSYQIASELEYFAVIYYRVTVLVNAVSDAGQTLANATGAKV